MAWWSGWLATLAFVIAALVPLGVRLRAGKRVAPSTPPIRAHVLLGLMTSACTFGHTLLVLPELGSPAATAGGMLDGVRGISILLVVIAHAGLGLQLRDEKLRTRAKTRRTHATTALLIAVLVAIHIVVLEQARR